MQLATKAATYCGDELLLVMSCEFFEIVTRDGQLLGRAPRAVVHRAGLWHASVNVLLFNSQGLVWIQRRSMAKDVCPGMLDFSVAEHVAPGESPENAARRGIREELGARAPALRQIGERRLSVVSDVDRQVLDREHQWVFIGRVERMGALDTGEVAEVQQWSLDTIAEEMQKDRSQFCPWFESWWQENSGLLEDAINR